MSERNSEKRTKRRNRCVNGEFSFSFYILSRFEGRGGIPEINHKNGILFWLCFLGFFSVPLSFSLTLYITEYNQLNDFQGIFSKLPLFSSF